MRTLRQWGVDIQENGNGSEGHGKRRVDHFSDDI